MFYRLPGVQVNTSVGLETFKEFSAEADNALPTVRLYVTEAPLLTERPIFTSHHREINVFGIKSGWVFSLRDMPELRVMLAENRESIYMTRTADCVRRQLQLPLLRTALECASAMQGAVSLHSACVEINGTAVCFTGPSGTGKSTRAAQWVSRLGAKLISGDRPSLKSSSGSWLACGVPWDGKERIFRNVQRPVKMICEVVRGETVSAERLSPKLARQLLMRQCFVPMWDTEAAAAVMSAVGEISETVPVVRLVCGPDGEAAERVYDLIYRGKGEFTEVFEK